MVTINSNDFYSVINEAEFSHFDKAYQNFYEKTGK